MQVYACIAGLFVLMIRLFLLCELYLPYEELATAIHIILSQFGVLYTGISAWEYTIFRSYKIEP